MNNTNKTHLLIERMCAKINDGRTITADDVAEMLDTIRAWRDLSDARVAAAYEAASDRVLANRAHLNFEAMLSLLRDTPLPEPVVVAVSNLLDGIAEAIRNLTPADEATALDRMIAEAVEDAARRYTHYCTDCESVVAVDETGRGSCGHGRVYDIRPNGVDKAIAEVAQADYESRILSALEAGHE